METSNDMGQGSHLTMMRMMMVMMVMMMMMMIVDS